MGERSSVLFVVQGVRIDFAFKRTCPVCVCRQIQRQQGASPILVSCTCLRKIRKMTTRNRLLRKPRERSHQADESFQFRRFHSESQRSLGENDGLLAAFSGSDTQSVGAVSLVSVHAPSVVSEPERAVEEFTISPAIREALR